MRGELLQYVQGRIEDGMHSGDMDPQSALMFAYRTLADELVLGGVYIKHFLADPAMALDDPYLLCHDLLQVCCVNGCVWPSVWPPRTPTIKAGPRHTP
jgi:hypothetical protein